MAIPLWAVFGDVLMLLGLTLLIEFPEDAYARGAGVASLIFAALERGQARGHGNPDTDRESEETQVGRVVPAASGRIKTKPLTRRLG
jgi:hypothetical protein